MKKIYKYTCRFDLKTDLARKKFFEKVRFILKGKVSESEINRALFNVVHNNDKVKELLTSALVMFLTEEHGLGE